VTDRINAAIPVTTIPPDPIIKARCGKNSSILFCKNYFLIKDPPLRKEKSSLLHAKQKESAQKKSS
jgi:hypothetical protein